MTSTALRNRPPGTTVVGANVDLTGGMNPQQLMELAASLIRSKLLPATVDTPEKCLAILLLGRELGLPTMLALRKINVIQGVPVAAAELQLALFKGRGGKSEVRVCTLMECTVWFKHPNGDEHLETYTMEDAKREQLAGKSNWLKMPLKMLRWRAISGGLKVIAPEMISGLYSPDEMGVEVNEEGEMILQQGTTEVRELPRPQTPAEKRAAIKEAARLQREAYAPPAVPSEPSTRQTLSEVPAALEQPEERMPFDEPEPGDAQEPDPAPKEPAVSTAAPNSENFITAKQRAMLFAKAGERDLQGNTDAELKKIIAYVKDVPPAEASSKTLTDLELNLVLEELAAYPLKQAKE